MKIKEFFQHIKRNIRREEHLPDEVVQGFLRVLENVRAEDVSCKDVFAQLDEYVEKEVHGEDAARIMPLLREHLDLCPDCCEEYEALMTVLEETAGN
jgi:hypothetical protein